MSIKIRPLHDRVVIRRLDEETKTSGGIFIPDNATEKPVQGKVLATGKGKYTNTGELKELDVKVNDIVLFGKYSGTEIKLDSEEYVVMREEDILGVVS